MGRALVMAGETQVLLIESATKPLPRCRSQVPAPRGCRVQLATWSSPGRPPLLHPMLSERSLWSYDMVAQGGVSASVCALYGSLCEEGGPRRPQHCFCRTTQSVSPEEPPMVPEDAEGWPAMGLLHYAP
jgi:hypothetical protein